LKKAQEDIKQQADRKRKEAEEWKKRDKVMLHIKDLCYKMSVSVWTDFGRVRVRTDIEQ